MRKNSKLWLCVGDFCVVTAPHGIPSVFLFLSRCPNPADLTVQVKGNGVGTSNSFSFDMFEFSGKNNEVYLHCKLELCLKKSNTCPQVSRAGITIISASFKFR